MGHNSLADARPYDFYHATNARRQGVGTLIFVHLFVLVICGALYLFRTQFGMQLEGSLVYGMGGVMVLVYLGFLAYALSLTIKGGEWVFAVRDDVLCVKSPAKSVGATFTVFVADIISITQVQVGAGDSSFSRLYVVSKDGKEYEITQNSGLNWPVLFAKLRELNPDIRKEYNTASDVWNAWRKRFGK